jgi:hypothetical protein
MVSMPTPVSARVMQLFDTEESLVGKGFHGFQVTWNPGESDDQNGCRIGGDSVC